MSEPPEPIAPQKLDYATPQLAGFDVFKIARWQRWLRFSWLAFYASILIAIVAPDLAETYVLYAMVSTVVATLLSAILTAIAIRRWTTAILLIPSMLIFPLCIMMLLSIEEDAKRIMVRQGIEVKLFGADMKQFRITDKNSNAG